MRTQESISEVSSDSDELSDVGSWVSDDWAHSSSDGDDDEKHRKAASHKAKAESAAKAADGDAAAADPARASFGHIFGALCRCSSMNANPR
jgi:hypothetical protein